MVKEGWVHPGTSFVLPTKRLSLQGAGLERSPSGALTSDPGPIPAPGRSQ